MSRKNTFWNKIKCCVILHTVLVMFSHVLTAGGVSKREGAERTLEEVWSSASVMVLLSRTGFKRIWRQLMQRNCTRRMMAVWRQSTARSTENRRLPQSRSTLSGAAQNDQCMTSKYREIYGEQTAPTVTFDFKRRCAEWSVYDIKVPRDLRRTDGSHSHVRL